jgi:outer membrane lipoprotein SlyB
MELNIMRKRNTNTISATLLSLLLAAAPVFAQKAGQSVKISTGIVDNVQRVTLQSEAGTGALIGGALGLLSAGGKSTSKKARNSIIGAGAGGALASASQGSRNGVAYTILTGDGNSIRVVTDQTEILKGDCVIVEESGSTTNVRRVTPTTCDAASARAREELQGSFQMEAVECNNAKQQLVEATTAEQVDLARRKMEILCSD